MIRVIQMGNVEWRPVKLCRSVIGLGPVLVMTLLLFTLVFLPGYTAALAAPPTQVEKAVVKIYATKRYPDYSSPWSFQKVDTTRYYGVRVSEKLILTTAQAVDDGASVEIEQFESYGRQPARIVYVDYECNLALVAFTEEAKPFRSKAVAAVGEALKPNEKVWMLSERSKQVIGSQQLVVEGYYLARSDTSWLYMPHYSFSTSQKNFGYSEPVFNERGQLVALVTETKDDRIKAVSSALMQRFLAGHKEAEAAGFVSLGIVVDTLITSTEREAIKAPHEGGGIRIAKVFDSSPLVNILQPNDVLIKVNEKVVDEAGYVSDRAWKRLPLQFYLLALDPRKSVNIEYMRQGALRKKSVKLHAFDSDRFHVPYRFRQAAQDQSKNFFQYMGMVFIELSQGYFSQWGKDWEYYAPLDLMNQLFYHNAPQADAIDRGAENGLERVVVLSRVLPDKVNHGYQKLRNIRLVSVNGTKVVNLKHLESLLINTSVKRSGKQFTTLQFANDEGEVVLFYDDQLKSSQRIATKFNIWKQ